MRSDRQRKRLNYKYTEISRMSPFFFNDTATTEIYTLSLHDALPISLELALDALIEFCNVDDDALVRPVADEILLVARLHAEIDGPSFHPRHFRSGGDAHPYGRGGDVAHIQVGTEALVARGQEMLDGGERGRLDEVDHHGRGEHPYLAAADARRRVL